MKSGETALALTAALAVYLLLLSALTLRLFTRYDGVCIGVVATAAIACAARRAMLKGGSAVGFGALLAACRRANLSTRIAAALSAVLVAVLYDRLDGDPDHYRLMTFVVPIIVDVVLFDFTIAIWAIVAGALAVDMLLIPPVGSLLPMTRSDALDLVIYVGVCCQIALAIDRFMTAEPGAPRARG